MTRARLLPALGAVMLAAGCGSPSPAPAPSPTPPALSGDAAKVAALAPKLRYGVLLRAIRDAGHDCQQVVGETRTTVPDGPLTYVATCIDQHRWIVAITPDGTARVTDAATLPAGR